MQMVMTGLCLALWAVLAALPARAEEGEQYRTVAGTFVVAPVPSPNFPGTNDGFDLVLNGRVIAHSDDYQVGVAAEVRDPEEGALALDRILLLEFMSGGTGCPSTWRVAEFHADGTALLSEEFDLCTDFMPTIERRADGALTVTFVYAPGAAPDAYLYRDGTIRRLPAVAAVRRKFPTAVGTLEVVARSDEDGGHHVRLVLNGRTIGEENGYEVEVAAAVPDPKRPRLLLLAFRLWSKACYGSWKFLEVAPGRFPRLSPPFGDCSDPPDIERRPDGSLLLRFSGVMPAVYLYADHRLQPAPDE
jgi:hypothetical protein